LPSQDEVIERLLDALRYEDDQWLWEIVWVMNTNHPDAPNADKVALARQVVLGLAKGQIVELWRGEWPNGAVALVNDEELERLQVEDPPWFDPEDADLLVVIRLSGGSA
jgi:hypothetical protein